MARGLSKGGGGDDDGQVEKVKQREGSILKIKMKDFITYDSVECTPGDSLNVVIGPNGTGKSTILSAIVLGLGGKPTLLGKPQARIQDFIKNNRTEATIEIELLKHKKNTIIKRTITNDGKTIWQLNGRHVPLKEIEAETRALNIQIDNLCQVLAQDRVQDFAKLNKQELLAETQKAVGKEGMSDIHKTLKELQRKQRELEIQIETDLKKKEFEQGHVDRLKVAVDKVKERRGLEREVEACRQKLSVMAYSNKKEEVNRFKDLKKEADTKVEKIEALIEPFQRRIREAEGCYRDTQNRQNGMDRRIRNQLTKVTDSRSELESLRFENILELEVEMQKQLKSTESQLLREDELRQKISKYRNDIAAQANLPQTASQILKLEEDVQKLAEDYKRAAFKEPHIDKDIRELNYQLTDIKREIGQLQGQRDSRLRELFQHNRDAASAARWVEANRNSFEKSVFLPMMVELDVVPDFARYVETGIGYQDMVAIVCESAEDMKVVVDNCRKRMGLRVNVLQADPGRQLPEPHMSLDDLRKQHPEFEGYLIDFVKGPNTLLNFLCSRKGFHNIPVALREIDADTISCYYAGEHRKGFTRSRYTDAFMYNSDPIPEAKWFKALVNDTDENALRTRQLEIERMLQTKIQEKTQIQKEKDEIDRNRNQARDEKRKLEQIGHQLETTKFHLAKTERELANLQRNAINPDTVRAQYTARIKEGVLKLAAAQESFYQTLKQLDQFVIESQTLEFDVQAAKTRVASVQRLCRNEQESLENAKREKDRVVNLLAACKTEAIKILKEIERKNNNKKITEILEENKAVFSTLPDTIEELESKIEEKCAHASMLSGQNDGDIVRQFERHVGELDRLITRIAERKSEAENLVVEMQTRENQWKTELNELVDTISGNFSRYFKEMGCAGEVKLYTGSSEHDYDNYGLRIRVKFRDSEELQDLNAHTQSGGERAVSTAIYMLALQELTPAPFRLVDEINQGMDAINERRVYELLLRSTSRPGTPQYFLLTPKLLKDMRYNPGTTVLCVMNSACAPNHKTWDMKKFISLRMGLGTGGRPNPVQDSDDDDIVMMDD